MPVNKRESLIYTVIMCFCMVFWMSTYNIALYGDGLSSQVFQEAWIGLPISYAVGFLLDWFLVSKIAKGIAFRFFITYESKDWKKIIAISTGMVIFMCIFMSLYGSINTCFRTGEWNQVLYFWITRMPKNFIMAWPVQIILIGPCVRTLFRRIFPVGTVQ